METPGAIIDDDLPVPSDARSVIVYGGTFDPPHLAHLRLPVRARDEAGVDWLVYVPAARSPFKRDAPVASDADRLEMLRVGTRGLPRVAVSPFEIRRAGAGAGPSYTIDTLRRFGELLGPVRGLRLLIGADQVRDFHRWKDADEIISLAEPLVLLREPLETPEALASHLAESMDASRVGWWLDRVSPVGPLRARATEIREAMARGGAPADALDEAVLRYIRERGLYGVHGPA